MRLAFAGAHARFARADGHLALAYISPYPAASLPGVLAFHAAVCACIHARPETYYESAFV